MLRTVKLLRLFSIILFFIALGFIYAFLPVQVYWIRDFGFPTVHKSDFFYMVVAIFLLVNIFSWLLSKMSVPLILSSKGEEAASWFSAFPFVVNVVIILLLGYVGAENNRQHIPTGAYNYLTYFASLLMVAWLVGLLYFLFRKKVYTIENQ